VRQPDDGSRDHTSSLVTIVVALQATGFHATPPRPVVLPAVSEALQRGTFRASQPHLPPLQWLPMKHLAQIDGHLTLLDLDGFVPAPATLPLERLDVPRERRHRAALLVLAIAHGLTPEDVADEVPQRIIDAFGNELQRAEALTWVDLLLETLAPQADLAAA
jgi:hypothetical protein